jgi:ABC-type antimicrobial peptide transport system permease subunit
MFVYVDSAILIWFMVIMGALIFGLINTLITAVMERIHEFGMLRAVGMKPGSVVLQVVLESSLIMLLGVAIGVAVGWLLTTQWLGDGIDLSQWAAGVEMAGMRSVLKPHLLAQDIILVTVLSLVFGVLAAIYPAWRAVKIKPMEALRR